jgi:hypothetical protein
MSKVKTTAPAKGGNKMLNALKDKMTKTGSSPRASQSSSKTFFENMIKEKEK